MRNQNKKIMGPPAGRMEEAIDWRWDQGGDTISNNINNIILFKGPPRSLLPPFGGGVEKKKRGEKRKNKKNHTNVYTKAKTRDNTKVKAKARTRLRTRVRAKVRGRVWLAK